MTATVPVRLLHATINRLERARSSARSRVQFAKACEHIALLRSARRDVSQLDRLIRNLREIADA
jgi:hypothetical protein